MGVDLSVLPQVTNQITVSLAGDATFIGSPPPLLEISVTQAGDFMQGQTSATYTMLVGNCYAVAR